MGLLSGMSAGVEAATNSLKVLLSIAGLHCTVVLLMKQLIGSECGSGRPKACHLPTPEHCAMCKGQGVCWHSKSALFYMERLRS